MHSQVKILPRLPIDHPLLSSRHWFIRSVGAYTQFDSTAYDFSHVAFGAHEFEGEVGGVVERDGPAGGKAGMLLVERCFGCRLSGKICAYSPEMASEEALIRLRFGVSEDGSVIGGAATVMPMWKSSRARGDVRRFTIFSPFHWFVRVLESGLWRQRPSYT